MHTQVKLINTMLANVQAALAYLKKIAEQLLLIWNPYFSACQARAIDARCAHCLVATAGGCCAKG